MKIACQKERWQQNFIKNEILEPENAKDERWESWNYLKTKI